MSPPITTQKMTTGTAWMTRLIMLIVVASQGAGLAFGGALQSFQGSFSIVLVGTPIVTIVAILRGGMAVHPMPLHEAVRSRMVWGAGLQGLRWGQFTRQQKQAILWLAATSAAINIGGPVAVRELNNGLAAGIQTCGSLAVGLLALRASSHWLVRGIALVAVLFAAYHNPGGAITFVGILGALGAASHMFNLPMQVVRLKPKQDEGLAVANIISAPFVLGGTFAWDSLQGVSWTWGWQEILGALCAGVLVMVIPVFLQNFAAKLGMPDSDQGAMAALASPVHAAVGFLLMPATRILTGTEPNLPNINQMVLFAILAMAAFTAAVLPKGRPPGETSEAGTDAEQPVEPGPESEVGRLRAQLAEARGKLGELGATLSSVRAVSSARLQEIEDLRNRNVALRGQLDVTASELRLVQPKLARTEQQLRAAELVIELTGRPVLSVAQVEDLLSVGLTDGQVKEVVRRRIRPFVVLWLRKMNFGPDKALEAAGELPKDRGQAWFLQVLSGQFAAEDRINDREARVVKLVWTRGASYARDAFTTALAESKGSWHRGDAPLESS